MHKPNLLLDVDGVLLDWLSGFEDYLLTHAPHLHRDFSGLSDVDNLEQLLGMPDDVMHAWIDRFHAHDAFEHLQPLPGAREAIRILAPWCKISCITASGSSPVSVHMRRNNLHTQFGDVFEHIICVDRSTDKPEHLQAFDSGYWVEDQLKNALMGVRAGHESFLQNALYNRQQHDDTVTRVNNLLEVGEVILSQLRSKNL
jgi:hypothetical protein